MAGKVNPLISMVAANQANYPCQARSLPLGTLISPYVGRLRRNSREASTPLLRVTGRAAFV
jgi:hypothetical protein